MYICLLMGRLFLLTALLVFSFLPAAGQFQPFSEGGKVGLRNAQGVVVVPPRFDALGWSDGTFSVTAGLTGYRLQNRWGLLHLEKKEITPPDFQELRPAGGDYFLAARELNPFTTKFGLLPPDGKPSIPFHYDGLQVVGLRAIVFNKNGSRYEHGVITLSDQRVIPLKYRSVTPLGTLRFAVEDFDRKMALFSESGEALTDFTIDSLSAFQHDYAIVYQQLHQGLITRQGEWAVPARYREIQYDQYWRGRTFPEWKIISADHETRHTLHADELDAVPPYIRIRQADRYGLLTQNWATQLPTRYEQLERCGPHWLARLEGKFGLIRADGSEVLPIRFDSLHVQGSLIRAVERPWGEPMWSVYDTFGIRKTKRYYDHILPFRNNRFVVVANAYAGVVDRYGNEQVACVYDSILQVGEEMLAVRFKGLYGLISPADRWLLRPQPYPLELVAEDYYLLREPTATWLKRLDGRVIYFTMNSLRVENGYLREQLPGQPDRLIGLDGREHKHEPVPAATVPLPKVEKRPLPEWFAEHEGMRGFQRDGRYGFLDAKGKLRVANRYEGIGFFSEGLAAVKILGRWGYVNTKDQVVINPNYDSVAPFSADRSIVSRDGRWGVINRKGELVIPLRYSAVHELASGDYRIELSNLVGMADRQGMVLIEPRFDVLQVLPNTDVLVRQAGKYGVLTREGLSKIPMVYELLLYQAGTHTFFARLPSREEKLFP